MGNGIKYMRGLYNKGKYILQEYIVSYSSDRFIFII
jgi:hypothetical protein